MVEGKKTQRAKSVYDRNNHSWGYAIGVSVALCYIADELNELNINIKKLIKEKRRWKKELLIQRITVFIIVLVVGLVRMKQKDRVVRMVIKVGFLIRKVIHQNLRKCETMNQQKCTTKNCRGEAYVNYLSKDLCKKCWEKQCGGENKWKKES